MHCQASADAPAMLYAPRTIAVLVPATTAGSKPGDPPPTVYTIALMKHLLPSLLETAACDVGPNDAEGNPRAPYRFVVYVGFDEGDPFFDDANSRNAVRAMWTQMTAPYSSGAAMGQGLGQMQVPGGGGGGGDGGGDGIDDGPFTLRFVRVKSMRGSPCWIWNLLAKTAFFDGADYFYQVNDDLRLATPCWARVFVRRLENNPYCPNFGVAGPRDAQNSRILTQAFVHRRHVEIFGALFPAVFKNWYSDDWITRVYGFRNTFHEQSAVVVNVQDGGTRYKVARKAGRWLRGELEQGQNKIRRWLVAENSKLPFYDV